MIQLDLVIDFSPADRHGVEDTGGLFAVFFQGTEKRGFIAGLDTAENIQVQFQVVFLVVKHASAGAGDPACDLLDGLVSHQKNIQLGPEFLDGFCQCRRE